MTETGSDTIHPMAVALGKLAQAAGEKEDFESEDFAIAVGHNMDIFSEKDIAHIIEACAKGDLLEAGVRIAEDFGKRRKDEANKDPNTK